MGAQIIDLNDKPLARHTGSVRYEALDGLRGVLALSVVLHHYFLFSGYRWFSKAWVAVDVFFLMSGLVLASAYHARLVGGLSVGDFLRQRIQRLYPLYLVSFFYAVPIYFLIGGRDPLHVFMGIFLVPSLSGSPSAGHNSAVVFPINDPSWSLFFEIWVGVVFAALYRPLSSIRRTVAATFTLFVCYLLVLAYVNLSPGWSPQSFWGGWVRALFYMLLGRLIWECRAVLPQISMSFWGVLLVVFLAACSLMTRYVFPLLFALGVILVASGLVLRGGAVGVPRTLGLYLGRISYALYLVHYPTWYLVSYLEVGGGHAVTIILSILLSLAIADVMTRLDEYIRRQIRRSSAAIL